MFIVYGQFIFIVIVCLIMFVALFIFAIQHRKLVAAGHTTAESIKMGQVLNAKHREWIKIDQELTKRKSELTNKEEMELVDKGANLERQMIDIELYGKEGFFRNLKEIFNE